MILNVEQTVVRKRALLANVPGRIYSKELWDKLIVRTFSNTLKYRE